MEGRVRSRNAIVRRNVVSHVDFVSSDRGREVVIVDVDGRVHSLVVFWILDAREACGAGFTIVGRDRKRVRIWGVVALLGFRILLA